MKRLYFLIISFIFITTSSYAQLNALFVNDNSVNEADTEIIYGILEQYLGTLDSFDAVVEERSPNFTEMAAYNLVIWYCGSDEDGLYFWNGKYEDNPNLEEYLDFGGSLWLMGVDFLNARYIKAPRNYHSGDFLFDYLGMEKWNVESYTDDNGLGVPILMLDPNSPVEPSLDSLNWENPPAPRVDGCILVDGCYRTYMFGPGTYMLHGEAAAFYYPAQKFKNISFTFDPAMMDSKGNMSTLLSDILMFYEEVLSEVEEFGSSARICKIYPNPANGILNIEFESDETANIKILDIVGNTILEKFVSRPTTGYLQTTFNVSELKGGIYFVRIETPLQTYSRLVVLRR